MTTILADAKLGVMVADSSISDDDRIWIGRKVWRYRGMLIGMAGKDADRKLFLEWFKADMPGKLKCGDISALILEPGKLWMFDMNYSAPVPHETGREAIGTGAKAAICAYEALGWNDPKRAVSIVCKHDAGSRTPVRVYRL